MIAPERVVELARKLEPDGVPAYVYDLTALDAHAAAIRAALPRGVQFYYAVKANPDTAVLRTLARHADGFEVSSGGELAHTAAAAPGRPLAFGGPGKTPAELAAALELAAAPGGGTTRFHVESPHELALLDQAARAAGRRVDVLLRVNLPGQDEQAALVMGGKPSPFGMDCELLRRCAGSLTPAVRLRGLHAHLASGVGADGLLAAAGRLVSFGRRWCAGHGVTEPEFNLGGGMAVDYTRPDGVFDWPGYGRGLAGLARPGETLRIEPGRAVTAYCGWYLTRVLDVKHSHGEAFAVVAGGTHHLRTPAAKGHDQPFAVVAVDDWAPPWPRPGVRDEAVTIAGQLCTPKDVLARRIRVGRLRAGDLVAFGLAGAYAWNISHHGFLMHPPPAFHLPTMNMINSDRRSTSVVAVCEHGADCHTGLEPSMASAPEASRAWLLIEHPGPWPHEAADAAQPAPLAALVRSAEEFGVRVHLIRRPGRRYAGDVRSVFLGWTAGPEPFLRHAQVSASAPELTERDLKELAAGIMPSFGVVWDDPLYLVCTHGKRNVCCARLGVPLAQALAARHPGPVWETTHVGGHRFAANLVLLPHGLYYGPVTVGLAAAAIDAYQRGSVVVDRYRGRAGQPRADQEAEYARLAEGGALSLGLTARGFS